MLADADIDRAANGIAWGGMFNSGQVCISVERVFVEAPVYNEFVAKLTEARCGRCSRARAVRFKFDTGAMATPPSATSSNGTSTRPWPAGAKGAHRGKADRGRHVLRADRARRRRPA